MTTSSPTARLGWPDMHLTWVGPVPGPSRVAGRHDAERTAIRPERDFGDGHPAAPR